MEFGSGIMGAEPPVDGDPRCVALGLVGGDLALQGVGVGVSPFETGAAQHAELDLRHVEPAGVFGRVVKLEPLHDAPGLSSREGLVKGGPAVGVQIVQYHSNHRSIGVGHVNQPAHLVGEVRHGASFRDRHVAPASQGFAGQEQIAGAGAAILIVLPPQPSRLGGQRCSHIGQQLGGGLVKAHHRTVWVVGFSMEVQHVLHGRHKLPVHPGDAPLLLSPGLERVF